MELVDETRILNLPQSQEKGIDTDYCFWQFISKSTSGTDLGLNMSLEAMARIN